MNEKIFYAIISLLVIVLSVAGYFVYQSTVVFPQAEDPISNGMFASSTPFNPTINGNDASSSSSISASNPPDISTILSYDNTKGEFAFSYPKIFSLIEDASTTSDTWSIGASSTGQKYVTLDLPTSVQINTNFVEGKLYIGSSNDKSDIKNCLATPNFVDNSYSGSIVKLNGRDFTQYKYTDAGAGNRYDVNVYNTVYRNQCYSISYYVRYVVLENYSGSSGRKEFNHEVVNGLFDVIVKSFQFI